MSEKPAETPPATVPNGTLTPPTPDVQVQSVHVPPTAQAAGVSNEKEGAGMDPAKLREAFGLSADSSDDDVKAALGAAGFGALKDATELPKDAPQDLAAAARASGAVIVDKGVWEQTQAQIQEGVAAAKKLREQERDSILAKAVDDGRIPPANREYWANLYDRDPKGTADVINSLKKNLVPVSATGYANYDDGVDPLDEFSHLFPTSGKGR